MLIEYFPRLFAKSCLRISFDYHPKFTLSEWKKQNILGIFLID